MTIPWYKSDKSMITEVCNKNDNNNNKSDNNKDKIYLLLRRWGLMGHVLDYMLDHILDHVLDHMLDHILD